MCLPNIYLQSLFLMNSHGKLEKIQQQTSKQKHQHLKTLDSHQESEELQSQIQTKKLK